MTKESVQHLEILMNHLAFHFLKKSKWPDVSKIEWMHITEELNRAMARRQKGRRVAASAALGEHYLYEHIIIKKLKAWKAKAPLAGIGVPNFSKLNLIAGALGYESLSVSL
jgi:hypothetical protein